MSQRKSENLNWKVPPDLEPVLAAFHRAVYQVWGPRAKGKAAIAAMQMYLETDPYARRDRVAEVSKLRDGMAAAKWVEDHAIGNPADLIKYDEEKELARFPNPLPNEGAPDLSPEQVRKRIDAKTARQRDSQANQPGKKKRRG